MKKKLVEDSRTVFRLLGIVGVVFYFGQQIKAFRCVFNEIFECAVQRQTISIHVNLSQEIWKEIHEH